MGRKFSILAAFCVVLFGAILAGYWDMLDSQKLREVREEASASLGDAAGSATAPAAPPSAVSSGAPTPTADTAPSAATTAGDPGTAQAPAPAEKRPSVAPSFDVLRIEPDGSAVLAGRAMPNSQIRLMDGATAIGSAKTSADGEFAVVLDERLAPGAHQIRIEADKGDGVKAISEQTAIVSVPKPGDGGELLAMVETPNQPSRIINLPDAKSQGRMGESHEQASAGADTPAAPPARSADASRIVSTAPPVAAGSPAAEAGKPAAIETGKPAAPPPFAVEAVEIENGTIYIAGRAPGTAPVRVYLDNQFIGEDKARRNDRFLVTAKAPIAVGSHEIRADMIAGDGAVASRVEVPFTKPQGEAMSAIASNEAPDTAAAQRQATPSPSSAASPATGAESPGASSDDRAPQTADAAAPAGGAPETAPSPGRDVAASGADEADAAAPAAVEADADVATIRQTPLEGVHTRVLIRRGDTLWRISRETYGHGRRYTVIYLANGDQIRNPNRIYPGQLFRLPKEDSKAID